MSTLAWIPLSRFFVNLDSHTAHFHSDTPEGKQGHQAHARGDWHRKLADFNKKASINKNVTQTVSPLCTTTLSCTPTHHVLHPPAPPITRSWPNLSRFTHIHPLTPHHPPPGCTCAPYAMHPQISDHIPPSTPPLCAITSMTSSFHRDMTHAHGPHLNCHKPAEQKAGRNGSSAGPTAQHKPK
jgi:hypothetical protein